eukprot:10203067-Lingulodinium_polyedra.AAC.1
MATRAFRGPWASFAFGQAMQEALLSLAQACGPEHPSWLRNWSNVPHVQDVPPSDPARADRPVARAFVVGRPH